MDPKQRRTVDMFNDELYSLLDTKPPVSKTKMVSITRAAIKGVKYYKHIVQIVEKFVAKCRPDYKVPGLYVIDSIVRQSRHQFGIERDVYAARFSRNLQITFNNLFTGCNEDDKPKIVRVLNLWQKNGVFNSQVIQPLLDMANPNSVSVLPTESTLSADSPNNLDQSVKLGQTSRYLNNLNNSSQYRRNFSSGHDHSRRPDKNLLDFDYEDEDDDVDNNLNDGPVPDDGDETPTEAEPPLSSTLNKIEMEQRGIGVDTVHMSNQHSNLRNSNDLSNHQLNMNSQIIQDAVLERWNRIVRQQSIALDNQNNDSVSTNDSRTERPRSRSPPTLSHMNRETYSEVKEAIPADTVKEQRNKYSDQQAGREAERKRKCLPPIRDKHLTVCSSTLWLGHVPKTVSEADISNAFGEYGAINSINLIPPRGCAYVCMDRRQDARKALSESKDLKLNGSHIKMAWAPGKGFKEYSKLKDFWESDTGSSYIPYNKIDSSIDFDVLEEGGVIDEDSMSMEMIETREKRAQEKANKAKGVQPAPLNLPIPALPILTQPPPFLPQPNQLSLATNPLALTQPNQMALPAPSQLNLTQQNQLNLSQPGMTLPPGPMNLPQPNLSIPPPNLGLPMNLGIPQINVLNQQPPMSGITFPQQGGMHFWNWGN